ncbi:hypothetical protein T36_0427 [Helicobacter cinaedi]|uniref:hypothetical protein n=1 Tax=Helicobacter cinaedi TaxID=213 RepID=UPI001F374659|nr:hypothetical protein [Helicobacter cinaedi]BDB63980.1 hypothetical protein T36_0427 [Helicobacter cinaedi]
MGNILEIYNHSTQQALANANNAASLVMETHKTAMQNNTNTINAINETLRESERNAIERERNDIANNQAIDNSFHQNSFTRMLAYLGSGMSDKQVQEQMDKDLAAHRAASGYKSNPKHYSLAEMAVGGTASASVAAVKGTWQGLKKYLDKKSKEWTEYTQYNKERKQGEKNFNALPQEEKDALIQQARQNIAPKQEQNPYRIKFNDDGTYQNPLNPTNKKPEDYFSTSGVVNGSPIGNINNIVNPQLQGGNKPLNFNSTSSNKGK